MINEAGAALADPLANQKVAQKVSEYGSYTPAEMYADIGAKIAAMQNTPVENLILSPLKGRFGARAVTGVARIYDTPEALKATEREYLIARGQPKAAEEE